MQQNRLVTITLVNRTLIKRITQTQTFSSIITKHLVYTHWIYSEYSLDFFFYPDVYLYINLKLQVCLDPKKSDVSHIGTATI